MVKAPPATVPVVTPSKPDIVSIGIIPGYDPATNALTSVTIECDIREHILFSPDADIVLKVFHDGVFLEEIPWPDSTRSQGLDYIPSSGWTEGIYDFQVGRYEDGTFIPVTEPGQIVVATEPDKNKINWLITGIAAGAAFIIAGVIVALILRRKLIIHL